MTILPLPSKDSPCERRASTPLRVFLAALALGLVGAMMLARPSRQPEFAGVAPAPDRPTGEQLREASMELDRLRDQAAGEFRQLAVTHEATARTQLERVLQVELAKARGRVPEFARWLLSLEAVGTLGPAWWNERLAEEIAEQSAQRLISGPEMTAHLQRQAVTLHENLGSAADEISRRHADRVASVLGRLDEPTRRHLEPACLITNSVGTANTVYPYQTAKAANLVLSTVVVTAGFDRLALWLGPKIGCKLASKGVRLGTGPVGWAVSLLGGWYVEKQIDEHLILPALESRLQEQLDSVAAAILRADGPAAQLANEQANLALRMAADLELARAHRLSTTSAH